MRSWQSILFERYLIWRKTKQKFIDVQEMALFIEERRNEPTYELDEKFRVKHQITKNEWDGMLYYVLNENIDARKTIVYFHGGAYINDPLIFHWRYLVKLAERTQFRIIVPIYPKLPHFTHETLYEQLHTFYDMLCEKYEQPFIFMGDSAGGSIALAFAQDVMLQQKRCAEQVMLFSPWLDVSGEDPRYTEIEKIDPMLGLAGAQMLGKLWANTRDISHHLVSPLHGPLQNIGRITLFVGTGEMLLVDAHLLLEKAKKEGVDLIYFEYPKMNHVFPVFPIPEAKKVWKQLLPILLK
ncbi:alpha/beta hydrolase fold domain-containing protein [Metasolibacillus meyeri]|uniref:alpha/beta hydrolase fold domain-containing protein n=1 Tax=Metasolibacillus meyeri TaxID=1071052 RepID=UPI000D303BA1|nr:alpha/beta hydrolase [Metasolibacillus meyeri]